MPFIEKFQLKMFKIIVLVCDAFAVCVAMWVANKFSMTGCNI
jgi:hypothetical protein